MKTGAGEKAGFLAPVKQGRGVSVLSVMASGRENDRATNPEFRVAKDGLEREIAMRQSAEKEPGARIEEPALAESAPGRRSVLVVEDNVDAAESLAMVLEMGGFRVRVVNDGFSALDAARRHGFDAFVVDIGLPGIDGYEVARRLRLIPSCASSLMVALTGYAHESDRREALSAGFDRHLPKPVDSDRLESILASRRLLLAKF